MTSSLPKPIIFQDEDGKTRFMIPKTRSSTIHYENSDNIEQQTLEILESIQSSLGEISLHSIQHLVISSPKELNEHEYSKCLSVIMKAFNYSLPSIKFVVHHMDSSSSGLEIQANGTVSSSTSQQQQQLTLQRFHVGPRFSESALYNHILFISGQVPELSASKCIREQTREVLEMIDQRLKEADTDKSRLLMVQIFLANMEEDFAGMNEIWDAWVDKTNSPPRATVHAKLARSEWRIEVVATAATK